MIKDRAIRLTLREIKYDVKFDSWLREKVANQIIKNANDDAETVDYAYKNDKAEDWLVRQIQDAVDNIYGELAWCTIEPDHFMTDSIENAWEKEGNDYERTNESPTEWVILFRFSPMWCGSMRAMRSYVSTYVREYVLSQWYRAAMPNNLGEYQMKADEALRNAYNEARSEKVILPPWTL